MHGAQLFSRQIFVMMTFISQAKTPNKETIVTIKAARFIEVSIGSESRPAVMEGSIRGGGASNDSDGDGPFSNRYAAVEGSILPSISVTLVAGKPLSSACL